MKWGKMGIYELLLEETQNSFLEFMTSCTIFAKQTSNMLYYDKTV